MWILNIRAHITNSVQSTVDRRHTALSFSYILGTRLIFVDLFLLDFINLDHHCIHILFLTPSMITKGRLTDTSIIDTFDRAWSLNEIISLLSILSSQCFSC
jgi:hypothetical protein